MYTTANLTVSLLVLALTLVPTAPANAQMPEGPCNSPTWVLHILQPLERHPVDFDPTLLDFLTVSVCAVNAQDECTIVNEFTAAGKPPQSIRLQEEFYHVNWKPSQSLLGRQFEIRFDVAGLQVGFVTYNPTSPETLPIKFRINNHPVIRARVLHEQGIQATQVAHVLADEFGLGATETTLILSNEGYGVVAIANALLEVFAAADRDAAGILKAAGFSAMDVGRALWDAYIIQNGQDAAQILKDVGYSCIEVTGVLWYAFDLRGKDALHVLNAIDCALDPNCKLQEQNYGSEDTVATENIITFVSSVLHVLPPVSKDDEMLDRTLLDWLTLSICEPIDGNTCTVVDEFTSSTPSVYEAEDATVTGCIIRNSTPGFTGADFADYVNPSRDYVEWTIDVANAGQYELRFRYALGKGDRPMEIKVNGHAVESSLSFPATDKWTTWSTLTTTVILNAGTNTVRATAVGASGPNLDHLQVLQSSHSDAIVLQENRYAVNWKPLKDQAGKVFDIHFAVAGLQLGFVDHNLAAHETVPIKFHIDNNPVIRARVLHEQGTPPTEIADALRVEFDLSGPDVIKILYEEDFDPCEMGQALQYAFGAGPEEAADWMRQAGMPVCTILRMLEQPFAQSPQDTVAILRLIGFDAFEVWRAVRIVWQMTDDDTEDLLKKSGYTEAQILEAIAPRLMIEYACLIDRSGPVMYLHPAESYELSSVDWFLERSKLCWQDPTDPSADPCCYDVGAVSVADLNDTVEQLKVEGVKKFWFFLAPDGWGGDLAGARSYVHAVRLRDIGVTDLQFWFFYPYNGPGTLYVRLSLDLNIWPEWVWEDGYETGDFGNTWPLGTHTGDWEAVILRFDNSTNELLEVYMSAHGQYHRYPLDRVELEQVDSNDHVVAYSSLNGHANFPRAGSNGQVLDRGEMFDIEIVSATKLAAGLNWTAKGKSFAAYKAYDFVAIDKTLLDAPWMGYDGIWGPEFSWGLTDAQKLQIVENIFGDGLRQIRLEMPGVMAEACCELCLPSVWWLPGYLVCIAKCTVGLTIAGEIALEAALPSIAPTIVDSAFADPGSSGPTTPAHKRTVWGYLRYSDERPTLVQVVASPTVAGTHEVSVLVSEVISEGTTACELCHNCSWPVCGEDPSAYSFLCNVSGCPGCSSCIPPCDLCWPEFPDFWPCAFTKIDVNKVELGIGQGKNLQYFDITGNYAGKTEFYEKYTYNWGTTDCNDGTYKLHARVFDANGTKYEYYWDYKDVMVNNSGMFLEDVKLSDVSITEGNSVTLNSSFHSTGTAAHTVVIDWGDGDSNTCALAAGERLFTGTHHYLDDEPSGTIRDKYTIRTTLYDASAYSDTMTTCVLVRNLRPQVEQPQPADLVIPVGASLGVTAGFSDSGTLDTHTAVWDWGDDTNSTQANVISPVTASHTYTEPAVYEIGLTITDDDGQSNRASFRHVVAYDDSQSSYAAGAGSMEARVILDPCDLNDVNIVDANFAFVSLDSHGPGADFELFFRIKGMQFYGATDNWSVVSTAAGTSVEAEGKGTINGRLNPNDEFYDFRITATDVLLADDTFQITIWWTDEFGTVYPFETTPGQAIRDGDIIVKD